MNAQNQSLQELQHIKKMMERSSRFISLSGLSGISAGVCALIGAWFAYSKLSLYNHEHSILYNKEQGRYIFRDSLSLLTTDLLTIAFLTFIAAFITSFYLLISEAKKTEHLYGALLRFGYSGIQLFL